jgi:hypothetical protein
MEPAGNPSLCTGSLAAGCRGADSVVATCDSAWKERPQVSVLSTYGLIVRRQGLEPRTR